MKMSPPTVVIAQPRQARRGRPRVSASLDVPAADVHLKMPPEDYDALGEIAKSKAEEPSIQALIRQAVKRFIADERGLMLRNKKT